MKETIMINGKEQDNIIQPPFTKKYSDEDREETGAEILTIRFNPKNREALDIIKYLLHESKDATAIKYAIEWARNDIQSKLSEGSWLKICSDTRRKPVMKRPEILEKS